MPGLRVVVASDVRLYCEGLQLLLSQDGLASVDTRMNYADALRCIQALKPDVLIIDTTMPEAERLASEVPLASASTAMIVLAVEENDEEIWTWAQVGVSSFVTRDADLAELRRAVVLAARNEALCSPRVARGLLRKIYDGAHLPDAPLPPRARLTLREHDVVRLVRDGLGNKEIAQELGIELSTVKNHVHNILEKLQVRRRTEIGPAMQAGRHRGGSR